MEEKKYRMRRGKLVEIPPEWVGKTVWSKTKRQRKQDSWEKLRKGKRDRKADKERARVIDAGDNVSTN